MSSLRSIKRKICQFLLEIGLLRSKGAHICHNQLLSKTFQDLPFFATAGANITITGRLHYTRLSYAAGA